MTKRMLFEDYVKSAPKQDVIDYYITQNHDYRDCARHFNMTASMFMRILKHYGIHKPKELHIENIKEVKLSKYGCTGYNNPDKTKETNIKKYGVDNQFKRQDLMEGIRKRNEEKYGSKNNIYKNHQTRAENSGSVEASYKGQVAKTKQTVFDKYGVEWASKSDGVKNAIRESLKETFNEKYGCDNYWVSEDAKRSNGSKNSHANLEFERLLNDNGISHEKEFLLENRYYDFKVGDMLIEINPSATHNSTWSPWCKDTGLDRHYHADKTDLATTNGFRCIHVWDWDDKTKIIKTFLTEKPATGARRCEVKAVSVADERAFLEANHFQGYAKSSVALGLYDGDELVMLMTFGKPRYSKKYQWELIRLCGSKRVAGGSDKLFKHFMSQHSPESIISYCDLSKFDGKVYTNLGFRKISRAISRHWYNMKLKDHITDKLLFKRGFDALLGNMFGHYGVGSDNEALMLEHGFVEIYDCGQVTYVWKNNK